jgi:serine/threonine-protein kinase
VQKALAKRPQARWQTASDFAAALAASHTAPAPVVAISTSGLSNNYELGAVMARGRLGSYVHEARHRPTGHRVAVRLIRREDEASWNAARTRFMREARMTPVNHPSILRVRDFGEEPDLVYIVTDFVPGSSLHEVLDRDGPFTWNRGRPLMLDLVSATRALHMHGLLAFGLTPSIIRVATDAAGEHLVISSAGILDVDELVDDRHPHRTLEPSSEMLYLAPELLVGEKPDGRTDIFTVGAIGYELFTGRRPFAATTLPQLALDAFSGEIPDPRTYASSLPAAAAQCLLRSLAWRPDKRYADVVELENAFRAPSSAHRGGSARA